MRVQSERVQRQEVPTQDTQGSPCADQTSVRPVQALGDGQGRHWEDSPLSLGHRLNIHITQKHPNRCPRRMYDNVWAPGPVSLTLDSELHTFQPTRL